MSLLKDQYFQIEYLELLARETKRCASSFSPNQFLKLVQSGNWPDLELMDRMRRISDCLRQCLPDDYIEALAILRKVARRFEGFDSLVFPDFVQRYGVDYPDASIPALEQFTEHCSSEFAVRPFIGRYPNRMFKQLRHWAESEDLHHRRLASEGCRPRLPWAAALKELKRDPSPIFPILEILKEDSEDYVRRSVANNLNDISKDHPESVIALVKRWKGTSKETDWIVKHACRSLLKEGRPDVMILFGFASPQEVQGGPLRFSKNRLRIGENLEFHCVLENSKAQLGKIRLEYVVHFVKKNGRSAGKVFQISERVEPSNRIHVKKRHSFKDLSTRRHSPGRHRFEIKVNGVVKSEGAVELLE